MVIRIMLNPKSVNMEGVTTLAQAQAANEQLKQGIEERNKQTIAAWEARTGLKYDPEWREHVLRPDGPFRESTGSYIREGTIRNGEWNGEVREYKDGVLRKISNYKNGWESLARKLYREDGTLALDRSLNEDGNIVDVHYGEDGKTEDYRLVLDRHRKVLFDSRQQAEEKQEAPAEPEVAGLLTGPTEVEMEAEEESPSTAMDAQEALNRAGERFRNRRAADAIAQDTALPETGAEGESDLDGLAGNTALSVGEWMEEASFAEVRPAEVGRQRRAGAYYPDIGRWLANTAFSIGERRKAEYRAVIASKRPDLPADEVDAFMGEVEKLGNTKAEKTALHWFVKGGLQLPEDGEKLGTALKVAPKFMLDPFAFASPDELLAEADRRNPKKQKLAYIDPDTVPELTNKRDLGHGVVVYDVEDSPRGQAAMRRIMNSHLGRNAKGDYWSPWCLLTPTVSGGVSESAKGYWEDYNTSGRGAAFYKGKLVSFQSSKRGVVEWWDMRDKSHGENIPVTKKVPIREAWGDHEVLPKDMRVTVADEYDPEDGSYISRVLLDEKAERGNKENGEYCEYDSRLPGFVSAIGNFKNGKRIGKWNLRKRSYSPENSRLILRDAEGLRGYGLSGYDAPIITQEISYDENGDIVEGIAYDEIGRIWSIVKKQEDAGNWERANLVFTFGRGFGKYALADVANGMEVRVIDKDGDVKAFSYLTGNRYDGSHISEVFPDLAEAFDFPPKGTPRKLFKFGEKHDLKEVEERRAKHGLPPLDASSDPGNTAFSLTHRELQAMPAVNADGKQPITSKAELKKAFKGFGVVANDDDGREALFPAASAGKFMSSTGERAEFILPLLGELYKTAKFVTSSPWKPHKRADGTMSKTHANYVRYNYYLNKVVRDGKEYYVRLDVTEQKNATNKVHSGTFSKVEVYEKNGDLVSALGQEPSGIKPPFHDPKIAEWLKEINEKGYAGTEPDVKPANTALSVGSRPGRAPVVEPGGDVREAGEGTLAWMRRKFVHSQTPVFDAVRRVMGVGREPPDALNVEAAAKNVHGKIRARQEMLQRAYLEPLKAILAQPGVDRKRFDDYALALHALERNRMIQERSVVVDPTTGEVVDLGVEAGSGVTNAWAERVIREIQRDPFAAQYKEAANILAEMNRFVLRGAVADGLLTEAQAVTWMRLSPHYVPLKSGGAAPGAIHKRATGRFTRPDSVLVNSMRQAYATVRNGELNRVNKTMADWIREYDPNGEQVGGTVPEGHKHAKIKMTEPQYVPKGSTAEALLRERGIRLVETEDKGGYWVDTGVLPNALKRVVRESVPQGDDIVTFWENGERKFIRFEGKRGRDGRAENEAARIADALNFKNVLHKEGRFWDAIRGLTRWKANVSTSWNPTFIVRNMGADVFNTANLMMIEGKYAELARTMRNYPEALRTIARLHSLRREAGDSKMERMFARCFCAVFCW